MPSPTPSPTPRSGYQPLISGPISHVPAAAAINMLGALFSGHIGDYFGQTPAARIGATIGHAFNGTLGQGGQPSPAASLLSPRFDPGVTPGISWGNVNPSNFDQPYFVNANGLNAGSNGVQGTASGNAGGTFSNLGGVDIPRVSDPGSTSAPYLSEGNYNYAYPNTGGTGIRDFGNNSGPVQFSDPSYFGYLRDFGSNTSIPGGNLPQLNFPDYQPGSPYDFGPQFGYDQLASIGNQPTFDASGAINGNASGRATYSGINGQADGQAEGSLPSLNLTGQASGNASIAPRGSAPYMVRGMMATANNPSIGSLIPAQGNWIYGGSLNGVPGGSIIGQFGDATVFRGNQDLLHMAAPAGSNAAPGGGNYGSYGAFGGFNNTGFAGSFPSAVSNFAQAQSYYGGGAEGNGGGYVPGMGYPVYEVY